MTANGENDVVAPQITLFGVMVVVISAHDPPVWCISWGMFPGVRSESS
jgi:hypothetical protein